jgi:hypothetical protein
MITLSDSEFTFQETKLKQTKQKKKRNFKMGINYKEFLLGFKI